MDVTYSEGPRYIDGYNLDQDVDASIPSRITELTITDPVTDLLGTGYEQNQKNKDGTPL